MRQKVKDSAAAGKSSLRFTATVDEETYQNVLYWSKKMSISVSVFLRDAIEHYFGYQNKDYDLPTLEIQRLNQLVDTISVLSSNMQSLEKIITSGFDSLISLTRGDNYLLEDDDGKLGDSDINER